MEASELRNRIQQLEHELVQKSDFISIMTHQLRTPLAALKWTFKMMLDGDLGTISETQRAIVARGLESSNQMIHLLADVSAANHVSDWTMHLKPEPMDPVPCIASIVNEFSEEAKSKGISLAFHAPDHVPRVLADHERACLVLQNLIENAIKYNRAGGSATVRAEVFSEKLVVSVHDTGIGIPLPEQKHIFSKFYRAENARKHDKGTGLGLYVGKQIIEAQGGAMWFESEEGIGSTFFFSLPLVR